MSKMNYPECIRELYDSEIYGEAIFLALIEVSNSEREKYHFGTLLQLETETKARLRPLLSKHQISLQEHDVSSQIKDVVGFYQSVDWQEFLAGMRSGIVDFLARFQEIFDAGPASDRDMLKSMIVHETSILTWLDMELSGESKGSLDEIIKQLQYPLPEII